MRGGNERVGRELIGAQLPTFINVELRAELGTRSLVWDFVQLPGTSPLPVLDIAAALQRSLIRFREFSSLLEKFETLF